MSEKEIKTFWNDHGLKQKAVAMAQAHAEQDALMAGEFWHNDSELGNGFQGCSVGCFTKELNMDSAGHAQLAHHFGLPVWLVELQDVFFEYRSERNRVQWHTDLYAAIPVGSDLQSALRAWIHALLVHPEFGVIQVAPDGTQQHDIIQAVAKDIANHDLEWTHYNRLINPRLAADLYLGGTYQDRSARWAASAALYARDVVSDQNASIRTVLSMVDETKHALRNLSTINFLQSEYLLECLRNSE